MGLPWVLRAPTRVLKQCWEVLRICLYDIRANSEIMIVQNPPSIPTLIVAQMVRRASGTKLIVDWHNTGYSILALRVGKRSPLVVIASWYVRNQRGR
jgi:beta-1,4-mannosyltransferase